MEKPISIDLISTQKPEEPFSYNALESNDQHITPFRRDHKKFSLYNTQKRVSQISILPKTLFN